MSNNSQALTIVGGAIGAWVTWGSPAGWQAGASIGAALGGAVGGAIDASKIRTEGPRLTDARTVTAEYGDPIPWFAGAARVGGQVWWISDRREIGTTTEQGKGGGPKNTTYTYEQDALFGLTSVEVGDVARIWSNGKLVWTQMPDADIDSIIASNESPLWSRITIYTGSSTQLPDPTYEAAVGAGNAPAYRGRCSVFIEGLQLGASGQMPNLTFEVVKQDLVTLYFHAPLTTDGEDIIAPTATLSTAGTPIYSADGALFEWTIPQPDYLIYTTPSGGKFDISVAPNLGQWSLQVDLVVVPAFGSGNGDTIRFLQNFGGSGQFTFAYRRLSGIGTLYATSKEGTNPTVETNLGIEFTSGVYRIQFDTTGLSSEWNVKWYKDGVLLHTLVTTYVTLQNIYLGFTAGDKGGVTSIEAKALKVYSNVGELIIGEPLQDVVEELCDRAGMPAGTYDATALSTITKPVRSLLLAQLGATRAAIQPLMLAYHFDATLTDKLYFKPRATTAVAIIPFDDLAAGVNTSAEEPFALTQGSDLELPAQVAIRYRNVDNDYQTGVEVSDRLLSGQVAQQSIEIALGMTPSEAKAVADVAVIDNLAALTRGMISLSMEYAHLQPADVVVVDGQTMRLGRKQDASGVMTFEVRRHDASTIISGGVTDAAGYISAGTVSAPSATELEVLDIPILRDADNSPGHYVAANGGVIWAGASVQRSINNVDYTESTKVLERAVFGTCTSTLANFTGVGVDERNSIAVSVDTGELASSTRAAMLLDGQINAMLIGSEIIRFVTATLTGTAPNRYTLTRLFRGQRGTEWAMAGHIASERCVLLRPQGLRYITTAQADIDATRYIKGVTVGMSAAGVTGVAYTNTGISQMPFAPVDLRVSASNGNRGLTWQRRTRLEAHLASPLPLGETVESYEVDVYQGSTLLRTISSSVPSITYTTAQQTTDGVTQATALRLDVYQMSGTVGRGYGASINTTGAYTPLPQIVEVTIGGVYQSGSPLFVTLAGQEFNYTTTVGDATLSGIATSLASLINADASYVSAAVGPLVTITGNDSIAYSVLAGLDAGDNTFTWAMSQTAAPTQAGTPLKFNVTWASAGGPEGTYPEGSTYRLRLTHADAPVFNLDYEVVNNSFSSEAPQALEWIFEGIIAAFAATSDGATYGISIYQAPGSSSALVVEINPAFYLGWNVSTSSSSQYIYAYSYGGSGGSPATTLRPQIVTLTLAGTPTTGWVYRATLGGVNFDYTALVTDTTMALVATGLAAVIDADAAYVCSSVGEVITITGDVSNLPFTYSATVVNSTVTIAAVITQNAL